MAIRDEEILLTALRRERDEVHEKLMQLDRIIKRIKTGEYFPKKAIQDELGEISIPQISLINHTPNSPDNSFPKNADVKVQVLKVFDVIGKAVKLKDLQTEYNKLSGTHFIIREIVRSLHKSRLLRLVKEKDALRGIFWVKAEWVENGQLLEDYKPEGFDMLYKAANLEFE
jgi:hypothetical protein